MNIKIQKSHPGKAKPVIPIEDIVSASIIRERDLFGTAYGILAGVTFAIALWAWDGFLLSQVHAFFPWLKLALGILLCGLVGGSVGWLSSRQERSSFGFLLWLVASALFSWITIGLPLQIMPYLSKVLEPELGEYLNYGIGSGYIARFWIAIIWIVIFTSITGILQTALVESAVFAMAVVGKIGPFLICIVLMGIGGLVMDDLVNAPFRNAITSVDTPIQFILDNQGKTIDPALSRKYHAGALRGVQEEITSSYKLIVSSYDENFGKINVLVKFEDAWVDCITVNGQASYCKLAEVSN